MQDLSYLLGQNKKGEAGLCLLACLNAVICVIVSKRLLERSPFVLALLLARIKDCLLRWKSLLGF